MDPHVSLLTSTSIVSRSDVAHFPCRAQIPRMAIELTKQETEECVASLRRFLRDELETELSEMQAGYLLRFFAEEIAPIAYNRGVKDAESYFRGRVEDLPGTCFEAPMTFWSKKRKGR